MPVMSADDTQATDFDGHWKDALEALLAPCVALFWPRLHAAIDWSCPPDFLDKELRALAPGRRRYRRYLDKLVRVRLRSGAPALMLLHLEIQQRLASHFARRMYTYFARLQETFPDSLILQFAIVTRSPRQTSYLHYHYAPQGYAQEGQDFLSLSYRVPVVHLQDWAGREQALLALAPDNPFALVVLAELAAARRSTPQTLLKEKSSWCASCTNMAGRPGASANCSCSSTASWPCRPSWPMISGNPWQASRKNETWLTSAASNASASAKGCSKD
ncbi:hypothetical protein [Kerstersia gyiorum]|uniref:hypothetical protein n=1 Tax=Kerstersia gyiorum TaxID=206506 RepID=UPI00187C181C|nr:hypothetical protein [Kerstersia gyiorum]